MKRQDPKWKKFEKIVAGINILKNKEAIVKFDDHIQGKKTQRKWQVDISIRFKENLDSLLTIIECKYLTRKVSVKDVRAFYTLKDDLGANKGIMVSAKGFQGGAIVTAEVYGIQLYTLTETYGKGIDKTITPVTICDFPIHFSIDAEDVPSYSATKNVSLDDFIFYGIDNKPLHIRKLIADIMAEGMRRGESYPLQVRYEFDQPMRIHLPTFQSSTVAYAINFEIGDLEIKSEAREILVTPQGVNYHYADLTQQENIFLAEELPIGVDTIFQIGKYYKNSVVLQSC